MISIEEYIIASYNVFTRKETRNISLEIMVFFAVWIPATLLGLYTNYARSRSLSSTDHNWDDHAASYRDIKIKDIIMCIIHDRS